MTKPRTSTRAFASKAPPRIRTDAAYPFAHHTMRVRVPAIIDEVIARNRSYSTEIVRDLNALRDELAGNQTLPMLDSGTPDAATWLAELALRPQNRWLDTDWFFAETYAYRQIVERVRYWQLGHDPFSFQKRDEYASPAHADAFERALAVAGTPEERAEALLGASLFGNRIDLSFAASRAHGATSNADDLLVDHRKAAVRLLFDGKGPLHVIVDNAGTELTLDLVLVEFVIREIGADVVLHVKLHPTFVSDATESDVRGFLKREIELRKTGSASRLACVETLMAASRRGQLTIVPHAFWNSSLSLWELPEDLERGFESARLVILKGDANYRRALGDALWPPTTPFASASEYFPAPLLALRTLKSDAIVGLAEGEAEALDGFDPTWRVNGRRGLASLGGRLHAG